MAKVLRSELIEAKASLFRSTNGLSETQPIDFKSLLSKLKILTLFRPLSNDFSGMCLKDRSNNKFILINSNDITARQNFTMAHELFHLFEEDDFEPHICNPGLNSKTASEKNADAFAAALLMPTAGLLEFIDTNKPITIAMVVKIEHYYRVSRPALLFRLQNIGVVNKTQREKLDEYSRAETARLYGYDTLLYHSGNEGVIIGDYVEKARRLFEEEKISEGHYIELLNKIGRDGVAETEED